MSRLPTATVSVDHGGPRRHRRCPQASVEAFQAIAASRGRARVAARLAARLALVHGIRMHETALAPWLTDAHCTTNGAALAQWVLRQLSDVAAVLPQDESERFNTLSQRLARLLADLTETQPW